MRNLEKLTQAFVHLGKAAEHLQNALKAFAAKMPKRITSKGRRKW
jgi:hypothetical protein